MLLMIGRRGQGKTLNAVKLACERMREGFEVYANFEILDPYTGLRAGRVYAWEQTYNLDGATVVIDEANNWVPSRKWDATPMEVLSKFAQSRKDGIEFVFTAQHEERVDKVVRELVDWIVIHERLKWRKLPVFYQTWTVLESIERDRLTPENRTSEGHRRTVFMPAWVYEAYSTTQLVDLGFGAGRKTLPLRPPSILWANGSATPWDRTEAVYRGSHARLPHQWRFWHFKRSAGHVPKPFIVPATEGRDEFVA